MRFEPNLWNMYWFKINWLIKEKPTLLGPAFLLLKFYLLILDELGYLLVASFICIDECICALCKALQIQLNGSIAFRNMNILCCNYSALSINYFQTCLLIGSRCYNSLQFFNIAVIPNFNSILLSSQDNFADICVNVCSVKVNLFQTVVQGRR